MINGHDIAAGLGVVLASFFTLGFLVAVALLCVERDKDRASNLKAAIILLAVMSFIWWSAALYH
jgi:uncharacterized membrane protein YhaH (DUF805 family)